jgi:putative transposase
VAQSLEARFGAGTLRVPAPIEWLTDNGPTCAANQSRAFVREAGFLIRATPAYSPDSNGMAEAFVKSFKRDYVYLAELHDAESVLRELAAWFEDYNEHHPHRGLGMKSPREFRNTVNTA